MISNLRQNEHYKNRWNNGDTMAVLEVVSYSYKNKPAFSYLLILDFMCQTPPEA